MRKLLTIGMCAMLGMFGTACSDDDIDNGSVVNEQQKTGESAYLSVNIIAQESGTRGEYDDADESTITYKNGNADEHQVNNIKFFFFDANGNFVSECTALKSSWTDNADGSNVERLGNRIVVVPNYEETLPTKMITVVNAPSGYEVAEGSTIKDFFTNLTNWKNSENGFVMTTSSFYVNPSASTREEYYYVNELTGDNFFKTQAEAESATPVEVYVERLAVKVGAQFATGNNALKRMDYTTMTYKLGRFKVNNDPELTRTFYAKFIGWGLNATASKSYFSKHLRNKDLAMWTNTELGFNWNHATNHRSYWCESAVYDNTDMKFPDHYWNFADAEDSVLDFISQKNIIDGGLKFDGKSYGYCNENTNSESIINGNHIPGTCTHVLLLAQLVDANGKAMKVNDEDLVKFNGNFYTRTGVKEAVINNTAAKNYVDADGNPMTADDLELVNDTYLNGHLCPQLNSTGAAKTWYNGSVTDANVVANTSIDDTFKVYVDAKGDKTIVGYKDGYMYYYATIRHLSTNKPVADKDVKYNNNIKYSEGYYGVVRNHWYDVTISGFGPDPTDPDDPNHFDENYKKEEDGDPTNPDDFDDPGDGDQGEDEPDVPNVDPGHGIEDPDEPIVPNPDKDSDYYLGANINILSWRLVGQDVKL
jgi:hypothetical protein